MTYHLVDVSKYQVERADPLSLQVAKDAGFKGINVALDRGKADDVLPAWGLKYVDMARSLGLGVCTYRWLDNRLSGKESARRAFERMVALGGPDGMAHAVDTESTATEQILRDYLLEMTRLLGRPIALYTGDWWWASRGWQFGDLAPYLWAAPNAGYLGYYPGDTSSHWNAGYGGWSELSVMQYSVEPLPGTGNCSFSAIRDDTVWRALTGESMATQAYFDWRAKGSPYDVARPIDELVNWGRQQGIPILGVIGNLPHLQAANPQDHTPFSRTAWPIPLRGYVVTAADLKEGAWADKFVDECRRGLHPWVKYVNHRNKQYNFKSGYPGTVTSSGDYHCHVSCRTDYLNASINMNPTTTTPNVKESDVKFIYADGRGWALVTPNGLYSISTQDEANAVARVLGDAKVVSGADYDTLLKVITRNTVKGTPA